MRAIERVVPGEATPTRGRCCLALAHAHAKAGNADVLMGYLGEGSTILEVLQQYATQYAERNLKDYQQFMDAVADAKIQIAGDEAL